MLQIRPRVNISNHKKILHIVLSKSYIQFVSVILVEYYLMVAACVLKLHTFVAKCRIDSCNLKIICLHTKRQL